MMDNLGSAIDLQSGVTGNAKDYTAGLLKKSGRMII
jgi:hypothetical protein